ncbi:cell envelope integrity protein CreD [Betaproteobacteria bacterium]|nr:cell envelope integrity protein CreD [Betaproteobacteria bacterium]
MDKKLVVKIFSAAFISILLLLPLGMIQDQITRRSAYQNEVDAEIAYTAAGAQAVTGPVLAIVYRTQRTQGEFRDMNTGEIKPRPVAQATERTLTLPGETLSIEGRAGVELRYRGIYQARLYHLDLNVTGSFVIPAELVSVAQDEGELIEARAVLLFGVSDLRGLDADPEVSINGQTRRFKTPKDARFDNIVRGPRLELEIGRLALGQANRIEYAFPLKLTGTVGVSIAPTAESNHIRLDSDWRHPTFLGNFLPRQRQIDGNGFHAEWDISHLARNFNNTLRHDEVLRVDFIDPVNIYLQSERAVKYGVLFIVLSFAAFFLGEILHRRSVHVMQYLLVGLALTIFFLLLVALSEHLAFGYAYLVSALGCIGLITVYLAGVFKSWRPAALFGAGFAALYAVLYAILQAEDNAFLMGSLLLFAVLAAIMLSTRRVDWDSLTRVNKDVRRTAYRADEEGEE